MASREGIFVSKRTFIRGCMIQEFLEGKLNRLQVSEALDISQRQVSRLTSKWLKKGLLSLEHGSHGKEPVNKLSKNMRQMIVGLIEKKYPDFNVLHLRERLLEFEKIDVSYSTLYRICRHLGQMKKKKRRRRVRKYRERNSQEGFLMQMDGSFHRWFGNLESCIIAGIDDATSDVPHGEFFPSESLSGYMTVLRKVVETRGIPGCIYVDRASWLSGLSTPEEGQFRRICEDLGISLIFARSPQGKGRIERFWGTLQDRLIAEMRFHQISTFEKANEYFNSEFLIRTWRNKFIVAAKNPKKFYRPTVSSTELDRIFCIQKIRSVRNDHTILWGKELYQITTELPFSLAKKEVVIHSKNGMEPKGFYGSLDLGLKKLLSIPNCTKI